jgi:hypothetical protein
MVELAQLLKAGSRYAESVRKFQPRVCFETLGLIKRLFFVATLKELRRCCEYRSTTQLLQSCVFDQLATVYPGFQSKPWAGICERFQRLGQV